MNHEKYSDPTADTAVKHVTAEEHRVGELITVFKLISKLCGYKIANRIELEDEKGKVWK